MYHFYPHLRMLTVADRLRATFCETQIRKLQVYNVLGKTSFSYLLNLANVSGLLLLLAVFLYA